MSRAHVRSEWLKLRSLPSTYLVVLAAVGLGLGIGALEMASTAQHWATLAPEDRRVFDPVADSFSGFQLGELAFGTLGVLTITAEYSSGTIGPTLVASPRRLQVYLAKVLLLFAVVLPLSLASALAAFLTGQYAVRSRDLGVALTDPHVLRAVLMLGLYLLVVTLVGLGLGAGIRHTGGALTVMVGLVFLAWPVARSLEGFTLPSGSLVAGQRRGRAGQHARSIGSQRPAHALVRHGVRRARHVRGRAPRRRRLALYPGPLRTSGRTGSRLPAPRRCGPPTE